MTNTEYLAYARSLDAGGKSAKFDVVLPYSSFSGHALVGGQPKQREMSGFDDPLSRFSMNGPGQRGPSRTGGDGLREHFSLE
jgi:hypothetical protein